VLTNVETESVFWIGIFYELAARPKIMPANPFKVLEMIISCPVNRIRLECSF